MTKQMTVYIVEAAPSRKLWEQAGGHPMSRKFKERDLAFAYYTGLRDLGACVSMKQLVSEVTEYTATENDFIESMWEEE